ncbi:MAG: cytochrome c [Chlorobi bacterium]|nr:cytochrome c [Chlorobiota bacterium]
MRYTIPLLFILLAIATSGCGEGEASDHTRDTGVAQLVRVGDRSVEDVTTTIEQESIQEENKDSLQGAETSDEEERDSGVVKENEKNLAEGRTESVESSSADEVKSAKSVSDECGEITEARIRKGATIYSDKGNCVNCHKGDGTGTPLGPDLTDQTWINISGDYLSIVENIRNGVQLPVEHPTPMPAMGGGELTDEEVSAVAAYVWSLSHSAE